jgi:hypothetical protein
MFGNYNKNVHSQNGEDGIIEEILHRLDVDYNTSWCVDIGAWDGILYSNTYNLVKKGMHGVFVEGASEKIPDLNNTAKFYKKIIPIEAFVSHNPADENSLDNILKRTPIPKDFECISIDIDSYDLAVWESLKEYSPKIVVIEVNSSIAPGIVWRNGDPESIRQDGLPGGNTFSATNEVAKEKGYTLVMHTGNNIYIRNDLIEKVGVPTDIVSNPDSLFNRNWLR